MYSPEIAQVLASKNLSEADFIDQSIAAITMADGSEDGSSKQKRALNSWMAFRTWYKDTFTGYEQKLISTWLQALWQQDATQSKWQLLARVFTTLRDLVQAQGEDCFTLTVFLNTCASLVNVIPADQYLQLMGWQLISTTENQERLKLVRTNKSATQQLPAEYKQTNLGLKELVGHCYALGMISSAVFEKAILTAEETMVVQPNNPTNLPPALASDEHYIARAPVEREKQDPLDKINLLRGMDGPDNDTVLDDADRVMSSVPVDEWDRLFDPSADFAVAWNPLKYACDEGDFNKHVEDLSDEDALGSFGFYYRGEQEEF